MKNRLTPLFDANRRAYVLPIGNLPKITNSEAVWRTLLTPAQFRVMRDQKHQKPFEVPREFEKPSMGSYFTCAGCNLPLYHSQHQVHGRSQGWLVFSNSIQHCVRLIQERSRTPQVSHELKPNTTENRPLRHKFFEPLNASSRTSLGLQCGSIDNTPFDIPSMGKCSSISKDGRQVSFGLVCSSCHCFLGTFFSVRAREEIVDHSVHGSESLSRGKHVVFPIGVRLSESSD